jgi:hypothetical protein
MKPYYFFNLIPLQFFYISDLVSILSINLKKKNVNKLFFSLFFMTQLNTKIYFPTLSDLKSNSLNYLLLLLFFFEKILHSNQTGLLGIIETTREQRGSSGA